MAFGAKSDMPSIREVSADLNAFMAKGCEYEGKLTFEGSVRIDGKFSGEIFSNDILLIGESAIVKAEIDVGTIIISGTVEGNISAKKMVELKAPALVRGTITTPALVMEQGVVLEGSVKMEERSGRKSAGGSADRGSSSAIKTVTPPKPQG
jgi:cytoskeletal protein CcmA (bactofilin family)